MAAAVCQGKREEVVLSRLDIYNAAYYSETSDPAGLVPAVNETTNDEKSGNRGFSVASTLSLWKWKSFNEALGR
jgi:hypothetical protein